MRTISELRFRVAQELANARFWAIPPTLNGRSHRMSRDIFPDPAPVTEALRGTKLAHEIEDIAGCVLEHRFPLFDRTLSTGPDIQWSRDYRNGRDASGKYFRFVSYLDFGIAGDHKEIWELNRHQHLVVLAQAYLLTRHQEYLTEIETQIESWLSENLFMSGINWTSALEVGFRALSWLWIFHLVGDQLTNTLQQRLVTGLYQHGCYLENNLSVYFSPNTHLLGEAVALHALGICFPSFPHAGKWVQIGSLTLSKEILRQVREDGSHFEQSSYYHVYALDMFLFHFSLAKKRPEYKARLKRMASYLSALMGPHRALPFLGDDDGGRFFYPYGRRERFGRASLATCAVLLNEDLTYDPEDLHEQAVWWIGVRALTKARAAVSNSSASTAFRNSGVMVLAAGEVQAIFDCGAFGPGTAGHSHSDTLSLVVRDCEEEILIDPGTYTYVGDEEARNWFRGSAAHSTVRIDSQDQASPDGAFRWRNKPDVDLLQWSSASEYTLVEGVCRYAGFQHRRRVLVLLASPQSCCVLLVRDALLGPEGTHRIDQNWQVGQSAIEVEPHKSQIGARSFLLVPRNTTLEARKSWKSKTFGSRTASHSLAAGLVSALPLTMWAAVVIGPEPQALKILEGDAVEIDFGKGAELSVRFDDSGHVSYGWSS